MTAAKGKSDSKTTYGTPIIWTPGANDYASVITVGEDGTGILACGTGAIDSNSNLATGVYALCYLPTDTVPGEPPLDNDPPPAQLTTDDLGPFGEWTFDETNPAPDATCGPSQRKATANVLAVWATYASHATGLSTQPFKGICSETVDDCEPTSISSGSLSVGAAADWEQQVTSLTATISKKTGVYQSLPDQIKLEYDPLTGRWQSSAGERVLVLRRRGQRRQWGFLLKDVRSGSEVSGKSDCGCCGDPVFVVFKVCQPSGDKNLDGGFTLEVTE